MSDFGDDLVIEAHGTVTNPEPAPDDGAVGEGIVINPEEGHQP